MSNLKIKQGEQTKTKLVNCACKLFAKDGFRVTRFDTVAKQQGLTTGALYHHFKDKAALFEGAFEACAHNVAQKVFEAADKSDNPIDGIVAGCVAYIETVTSPKYKRIMLEDSISVLGWVKWKEIDDRTSESGLLSAIEDAQAKGLINPSIPSKILTRFISGGTNELALWVAEGQNKKMTLIETEEVIRRILQGLK